MKRSKRLLTSIIVFCFIVSCFSPIQAHALQQETAPNNQSTESTDQNTEEKDKTTGQTTGQAIEVADDLNDPKGDPNDPNDPNDSNDTKDINDSSIESKDQKTENNEQKTEPKDQTVEKKAADDESLWYRKKLPMKKEHQKLLWDYCKKRNLDYIDMLALIYTESNFYEKCTTGKYYGYFQISKGNCENLASTLKTKNKPLDGTININWGTAMYSWILADKRVKNLEGKKQRDAALSIYQRGTGGYDKSGISTRFLKTYYKKRGMVCSWFGLKG